MVVQIMIFFEKLYFELKKLKCFGDELVLIYLEWKLNQSKLSADGPSADSFIFSHSFNSIPSLICLVCMPKSILKIP